MPQYHLSRLSRGMTSMFSKKQMYQYTKIDALHRGKEWTHS